MNTNNEQPATNNHISELEHTLSCIAEYFNMPYEELRFGKYKNSYTYPKSLFLLFVSAESKYSISQIAKFLDTTDRSYLTKIKKKAEGWHEVDPSVKKDVNAIRILLERPSAYNIIKNVLQRTPVEKMDELAELVQEFQVKKS